MIVFLNDNYVGGEIHFAEIDKVLKNQPALYYYSITLLKILLNQI